MGPRQLLSRLASRASPRTPTSVTPVDAVPYDNDPSANIDENALMESLFRDESAPGTMIDVGAHYGGSSAPFLQMGWNVVAIEPDRVKHATLRKFTEYPNFSLLTCAVGDQPQRRLRFYTSEESSGIASLVPFRDSHRKAQKVRVRTLTEIVESLKLTSVDYLKIDAEGFDLRVLRGFPFKTHKPRGVLCEFEDAKTRLAGFTTHDLGGFLHDLGYRVFLSEWHPIVRYGTTHRWRDIKPYPCQLTDPDAWGNFIAVEPGPLESRLRDLLGPILD